MRTSILVLICWLLAAPMTGCAIDSTLVGSTAVSNARAEAPGVESTPETETFRVEVDVVGDVELDPRVLKLAGLSFASIGIAAEFVVTRESGVEVPTRLIDRDDRERVLVATRSLGDHVHVIVAPRGLGAHGVTHYPARDASRDPSFDGSSDVESAGAFVFVDSIVDDYEANELLADAGLAVEQLIGRTLAHELGHTLGCPHGGDPDAGTVMVQNSALGPVTESGIGRWQRALAGDGNGFAAFGPADRACINVAAKLSVELARPAYVD